MTKFSDYNDDYNYLNDLYNEYTGKRNYLTKAHRWAEWEREEREVLRALKLAQQREKRRKWAEADRRNAAAKALAEQQAREEAVIKSSVGYTSVLTRRALAKVQAVKKPAYQLSSSMVGCWIVGIGAGFVLDATMTEPLAHAFVMGPTAAAAAVAAGASSAILRRFHRGTAALGRAEISKSAERAALRTWLSDRYGLSVADDALERLLATVHADEQQCDFEDNAGRFFKFMKVLNAEGWLVFQTGSPLSQRKPLELGAGKTHPRVEFTGEAALLSERVAELLALLSKQPLSAEQTHVVNRAQQDVRATATTLSELAALGDSQAGQQRAAAVLGQLVEDLNALVAEQKGALLRELDVQNAYVRERRRPASSPGRLSLPAPNAALNSAAKEEVK